MLEIENINIILMYFLMKRKKIAFGERKLLRYYVTEQLHVQKNFTVYLDGLNKR
jgi:hypothetical protein